MKSPLTIQDYLIPYVDHQIYFTEPVIVKNQDVSIFECWAVVSNEGIWLMDEEGKWYKWQPCDQNAELVMEAIVTRFMILKKLKEKELV